MKFRFFVMLFLLTALPACGYQFAGRMPVSEVTLEVQNGSEEPGLPLVLRRGLTVSAERAGVSFDESGEAGSPLLEVTIGEVTLQPAGIQVVSGDGRAEGTADVGATTWDVEIELQARLLDAGGREWSTRTVLGRATYSELGVPVASEAERQRALRQALGPASEELMAWVVTQLARQGKE